MCQITPGKWDTVVSHPLLNDVTSVEYVAYNNRQSICQCDMTYALSSYRIHLHEMSMHLLINFSVCINNMYQDLFDRAWGQG